MKSKIILEQMFFLKYYLVKKCSLGNQTHKITYFKKNIFLPYQTHTYTHKEMNRRRLNSKYILKKKKRMTPYSNEIFFTFILVMKKLLELSSTKNQRRGFTKKKKLSLSIGEAR